jgi:cytochrome c
MTAQKPQSQPASPWAAVALAGALLLGTAPAWASEALADKHACSNCHAVDKKMIGPSFKAVAEKYKGPADAVDTVTAKVRKGGTGVWGAMVMPPMAHVPEADAKELAAWILKQ